MGGGGLPGRTLHDIEPRGGGQNSAWGEGFLGEGSGLLVPGESSLQEPPKSLPELSETPKSQM